MTTAIEDELADVRMRLAALDVKLTDAGQASTAAKQHADGIAALEARFKEQADALTAAREAATGLRSLTSPDAILARAPAVLCAGTGFERAQVSRLQDVQLQPRMVETEVVRRRRAKLVLDHDSPSLVAWGEFVVAPLLTAGTVFGILHADRGEGEALDELDRDVLWEFASTLSQAYESAGLRRALRRERAELRRFVEWLDARSLALAEGPATLAACRAGRIPATTVPAFDPQASTRDDRLVLSGVLTRRELDVLRLLATGSSNRAIADTLVISETTVKFHVNSILRKLHVANRAQAVARYLAPPGGA